MGVLTLPLSGMRGRGIEGGNRAVWDSGFFGFAHKDPYGLAEPGSDALECRNLDVLPASLDAPVVSTVHFDVVREAFLRPFFLLTVLPDDAGNTMLQGGACGSHERYFTADDLQSQAP